MSFYMTLVALEEAVDIRATSLTLFRWLKIYLVSAAVQTFPGEHF